MGLATYEGIEYLVSLLSDLIRLNRVVFALCIYTGLEPLKLHYKKYSACISLTRCFLGVSLMQTEEIECGHYLYVSIGNLVIRHPVHLPRDAPNQGTSSRQT